jgi:hypothetical protein
METITRATICVPIAGIAVVFVTLFAAGCSQPTSPSLLSGSTLTSSSVGSGTLGALSSPAEVPFKGTFQGNDTPGTPPLQSIAGNGTHVGEFSASAGSAPQSTHWIAANGDSIDTTYSPISVRHVDSAPCQVVDAQPEDGYAEIIQMHVITGGTGRFAGVQGSFTLTKYHDLVNRNGTNGTCGSFDGTITSPGAAH